jgi:Uma2 family endonuclease
VWLVDPDARTLEAYRHEHGQWLLLGTWRDSELVRAEPFEVLELELGALWES